MFKKLTEKLFTNPIHVMSGDTVTVEYTDAKGETIELDSVAITTNFKIEKLEISEMHNELGFSKGVYAAFGETE